MGRLLITVLVAASLGCGAKQPQDTLKPALEEASRAMSEKDAAALFAMLHETLRVGMTQESLAGDLEKNGKEYSELSDLMASPTGIEFRASVKAKSGETLEFVLEGEEWKLDTQILGGDDATDPIQALKLIAGQIEALRAQLADSGLLASQHEKGFLVTLEKLASEIVQVRPEDLVLAEDRCYVNLPSGRKIELVREEGVWKLFSMFPALEFR